MDEKARNSGATTIGSFMKTTEFVTNINMGIVPHSPYSLDIVPFDFALLPN
jgi:hypothetical protein